MSSEAEDRSRAAALLAAHMAVERARRTASALREVSWEGPYQLVLHTVFEQRGVRYELQPASRRGEPTRAPDPWACDLRQPDGAGVGDVISVTLRGEHVQLDCGMCSAVGEADCLACEGTGQVSSGGSSSSRSRCGVCDGRGRVTCPQCKGSGGMIGAPTVWSRIEEHEEVRAIGARGLPVDVAADLAVSDHPGEVVHRLEGTRIEELAMPAGYRDGASRSQDLVEAAARLCEHHGVAPGARIVRQVLEVRRIRVAHLRLEDGTEVWCWGDPPRIHPEDALDTFWVRVARARGAIALAVGAVAAIVLAVIASYV